MGSPGASWGPRVLGVGASSPGSALCCLGFPFLVGPDYGRELRPPASPPIPGTLEVVWFGGISAAPINIF